MSKDRELLEPASYWCVYCMKRLVADEYNVIVHDDVPHDHLATHDEDERPQ